MGSCLVSTIEYGISADEAYDKIYEHDLRQYGDDAYNGSFTTCTLRKVLKLANKYTASNQEKAYKLFQKQENVGKWEALGIDMGIHHYEIIKPRFTKVSGKTFVRYCVHALDDNGKSSLNFKTFDTMDKAKEYALFQTAKLNRGHAIQKKYITEYGQTELATVTLDIKTTNRRPKTIPKGCTLREIHAYYFFGWASC